MDPDALGGMIFALIMVIVLITGIGGTILLGPLAKRLGQFLEVQILERKAALEEGPGRDDGELVQAVRALEEKVDALQERQDFMERLLASGKEGGP
jgi:hypothetical protein